VLIVQCCEWAAAIAAVVLDVFVGQMKSALTCLTCGYVSNTFDPFLDLSLPIPKVNMVPTGFSDMMFLTCEPFCDMTPLIR